MLKYNREDVELSFLYFFPLYRCKRQRFEDTQACSLSPAQPFLLSDICPQHGVALSATLICFAVLGFATPLINLERTFEID